MTKQWNEFEKFSIWHMKTGAKPMTEDEISIVFPKFKMYEQIKG